MFDAIIIGLGPAGSTLARLIGSHYKVLVLDKRLLIDLELVNIFEKSCGGLLAPDAQEMLAKMGLGLPKNVLTGPQLFTVRSIDIPNSMERYYQRHYININREKFDRWAVSLIPDQVDIRCGVLYKSAQIEKDSVKVTFTHDGKEYTEQARILVGADGAMSKVRKEFFNQHPVPKTYISIQEWFEADEILPFYSAIFDEEICDFYSWTIPKENLLLVGSALKPYNKPDEKFELLKKKLSGLGYNLKKKIKRNGAFIFRPEKVNQITLGNDRVALIGEAAGLISPSSAEGLSYAYKSAIGLAKSIQRSLGESSCYYHSSMKNLKRNIFLKNLKCPFMYDSFLRKTIMKSNLKSMHIYK